MRRLLGRGEDPLPVEGDKLVCLRNDHEEGLLNGTLWEVTDAKAIPNMELMSLTVKGDGAIVSCSAHTHYFKGIEDQLKYYEIREAQCFDYGYALTTHKAQGSQWPNVFVFDESWVFRQRGASKRWLYTAITRASDKVTICRA
jgi:exodeoxyribonuclease-5